MAALLNAATAQPILHNGNRIDLHAGPLQRSIQLNGTQLSTRSITVNGTPLLHSAAPEIAFRLERAIPNQEPAGLSQEEGIFLNQQTTATDGTDTLDIEQSDRGASGSTVEWEHIARLTGENWSDTFKLINIIVSQPEPGTHQLLLRARVLDDPDLEGLSINLFYEIYQGYPVIRKWVEFRNNSPTWLKLSELVLEDIQLNESFLYPTYLTPSERGAVSSIVGFDHKDKTKGVILASEIPSALRSIRDNGSMGYNHDYFEWTLGPGESFLSEPVFMYAYAGERQATISAESLPLDRAVEGPFKAFLKTHVGVAANHVELAAPVWCTWTNFAENVNDEIIREQAELAAKAGFKTLQIDDGWQHDRLGVTPDPVKFPDFDATSRYVRSQGLWLGLWVSCFRSRDSNDLKVLPDAASVPEIRRLNGVAMSFASPWAEYYGDQLAALHDRYKNSYYKQDFSNIKYGDFGQHNESRSKKESHLRGLRGLLQSQATLRRLAPKVSNQITHEIYWGTPGVPCDLAAIKFATSYHIPPNDYSGSVHWKKPFGTADIWETGDPVKFSAKLLQGCFNARKRFYEHRGLPLECLEYYGAATTSVNGSLTPEIQDRQICSWLMGAPFVFAGDLKSLNAAQLARYHDRFSILKRLQSTYDIYRHFQYSGVPAPTDTDWHWWGKLNPNQEGAVVVMRGSQGSEKCAINIPWVDPNANYQVKALLADKSLGSFKGQDLIDGKLTLSLPLFGQEILELALPDTTP